MVHTKLKSDKIFKRVMRVNVILDADSPIGDLMSHFDDKVVMKLIRLYSGKMIKIPSASEMWRVFRNKVVRYELDKKDTKERRVQLAVFFDISFSRIAVILRKDRDDFPNESGNKLTDMVRHIYYEELSEGHGEVKEVYSSESKR